MPHRLIPFELGLCSLLGIMVAHLSATGVKFLAVVSELPPWLTILLGPLGGMAGTLVAVWWLAKRLNAVETAATLQRQHDHDALMQILSAQIEVATKCHIAIETNTRLIQRIEDNKQLP